ncbi:MULTISPECIES: hypothetical protein [Arthrobacter]|uniref:Uncharacterized protein n=1 Tax=Arthrobacter caoxuetaonis TaxID=2886935 RepID=A0A9X1MCE9_9MICC|nr:MULTISPECIES: hypothetical protein [Arthrobacter]MCC3282443.1 hypothetical protein [Arthrobacter caoxuetaonis]MCC3297171.1 hypothetical protein [Arthrobacter caoxuetaonis]MCC9194060.1 hypothetical protein [Arthrobacter sp. zg-Y916]USQ58269.1 hypothetical protein NF551_05385 [Arthrobacter caoxuetaonis]
MWRQDGTKLTGRYCTWQGQEYEVRSLRPRNGTFTLVVEGGPAPGPDWRTIRQPNQFAYPDTAYVRRVPAAEVSNLHEVTATGSMGPGRELRILAEDRDGNLAVQSIDPMAALYKRQLINNHGFEPFSRNEPLEHVPVSGWLPAGRIRDINVETVPFDIG